jgi:hypothetical protein
VILLDFVDAKELNVWPILLKSCTKNKEVFSLSFWLEHNFDLISFHIIPFSSCQILQHPSEPNFDINSVKNNSTSLGKGCLVNIWKQQILQYFKLVHFSLPAVM